MEKDPLLQQPEKERRKHYDELDSDDKFLLGLSLTYLIVDTIILVCIWVFSSSAYYSWFYGPFYTLDIILTSAALRAVLWCGCCAAETQCSCCGKCCGCSSQEDKDFEEEAIKEEKKALKFSETCYAVCSCALCPKRKWTITLVWRWYKIIQYLALVIIWLRPFFLYCDVTGYCLGSRAQKSSCTSVFSTPNTVFNLFGSFQGGEIYSVDNSYVFCPVYQKWANPSVNDYVAQFLLEDGAVNCYEQQSSAIGSSILTLHDQCPEQGDIIGFPSLARGIPTGSGDTPAIQPLATPNTSATACPGYIDLPQCYRPGTTTPVDCNNPICRVGNQNICPFARISSLAIRATCLPYWRYVLAGTDTGPAGYETYTTTENAGSLNSLCAFCPGLGYGWLAGEQTNHGNIVAVFWLATVHSIFLPFAENFLMFVQPQKTISQAFLKLKKKKN